MMPVDPRMLINALRQQPEPMGEPDPFALPHPVMQMAAASAMSPQEQLRYCQADPTGVGCEKYAPPPATPAAGYSQGRDNSTILDFKQRQHADRAKAAGVPATTSPEELDRITLQRKLRKQ
jgi:hypothetical protein